MRLPLCSSVADAPALRETEERKNFTEEAPAKVGLKILIVDDNVDAAEMLKFALSMENHEIRVAHDGAGALKIAADFQPEAAILDIGLPDIDGFEVGRRLRRMFPRLLIAALSGWGQEEDRRRSREAGFDFHFVKPVAIEEVEKILIEAGH